MNSGPLSVTSIVGLPRVSIKRRNTSATRRPPIEVREMLVETVRHGRQLFINYQSG